MTVIGGAAFANCQSLTSIKIPDGVTVISSSAFSGCNRLASIEILNSVTEIGEGAFDSCSALKTVKVPEGLDVSKCGLGEGVQIIYY